MNRWEMLENVQTLDFAVLEAALYLDTHPDEEDALEYFHKYQRLAREARREYEDCHGPLTYTHQRGERYWQWVEDPWPWEGEA